MKRFTLLIATVLVTACATHPVPPPEIKLDEPVVAVSPIPEPPKVIEVVEVPQLLPLPGQLKPMPIATAAEPSLLNKHAEPGTTHERIAQANEAARMPPSRDGYLNAIQVWPYSEGALYQVYASPGRVTDIALQEGEELVTVSAGDTVRWIVGDTVSGSGATQRTHILIKPMRPDTKTNLVIHTNRRTYLIELTSTEQTWLASVSWDYPKDRIALLRNESQRAEASAPVAQGIALERLKFRYDITGDNPSWKPIRAFDDGERVYIQFPPGIAQGELPPVFVIGPAGDAQLVNYRFRTPYYVIDRLFGAAELRLGGENAQVVRISRSDGHPNNSPSINQSFSLQNNDHGSGS